MEQINKWTANLKGVLAELRILQVEDTETIDNRPDDNEFDDDMFDRRYCWSPSENPELDLPKLSDDEENDDHDEAERTKSNRGKRSGSTQSVEFDVEGDVTQPDIMVERIKVTLKMV